MSFDPNEAAERWAQRMSSAGERYKRGVMKVTEAPNAGAARMEGKYLAKIQEAVSSGAYRRGNQRVTLSDWQQACADKGASRIGPGATAAKSKMARYLAEAKPHYDALQAKLASMPNNTLEDAKARAVLAIEHMASLKGRI